jgi:pyruvate formate lyase activating enzyme
MAGSELDRRAFLAAVGRCAGSACLACAWGPLVNDAQGGPARQFTREVEYYERFPDGIIQCDVCPHQCMLSPGEVGFCRARTNVEGRHYTKAYANPCILRVDTVEKLPLSHFVPGEKMLTIAAGGCNLRCLYCQNWEQSQRPPDEQKTFHLPVKEAIESAKKKGIRVIGFTYTDPIAFLEYAKDIAVAARKAGLKVAVGSALHVNPEPLLDLAQYVDAFAITLKGFDEKFYREVCAVERDDVLAAIETLKKRTRCWFELINLIVPTYNDDLDQIEEMARWVHRQLGANVPLHFARFVPMYKLQNLPRTPVQTLEAARQTAQDVGLRYVYTANIAPHEGTNTYCARCGEQVIQRLGFKILENRLRHGVCPNCRRKLPGVWE